MLQLIARPILILLIGGLVMTSSSFAGRIANINKKIEINNRVNNELMQEQADRMIELYDIDEETYFDNISDELDEPLTEEDYSEYQDEFLDSWMSHERYNYNDEIDINQNFLKYLKKQLPKDKIDYIDLMEKSFDKNMTTDIIRYYILYKHIKGEN